MPKLGRIAAGVVGVALVAGVGCVTWTVVGTGQPAQPCRNGYVALTFDDGPSPNTLKLLAALKRYHLRATFFDIGEYAQATPHMVRETMLYGNDVENHTWDHRSFTGATHHTAPLRPAQIMTELTSTKTLVTKLTGHPPRFFRSPYGDTSLSVQRQAGSVGMTEVGWTVDSQDYDGIPAKKIVSNVLSVRPGGVVVLHDTVKVNTIDAIQGIASRLHQRGLCAGRLAPSKIGTTGWEHGVFHAQPKTWETPAARPQAATQSNSRGTT